MRSDVLSQAYARVWAAFLAAGVTADGRHDTPHWSGHRGRYAACVIRVRAEAIQPALDTLEAGLEHLPGLRLHPDYFLHIMLQELGFVVDDPAHSDEISAGRLEEFAHAAIEPIASMPPLSLRLGGANAFHDAVFLEIGSSEAVARLHTRLFDLAAIPAVPDYAYLPHCTIAHFAGGTPVAEAAQVILPWRDEPFGQVVADEVEIVTLKPSQAYPALESYAVIPFGT